MNFKRIAQKQRWQEKLEINSCFDVDFAIALYSMTKVIKAKEYKNG
jgi:hypothetical protein